MPVPRPENLDPVTTKEEAWNLTVTSNNTEYEGNLQIQIRPAGGGATLVTNTYYIYALRGSPL